MLSFIWDIFPSIPLNDRLLSWSLQLQPVISQTQPVHRQLNAGFFPDIGCGHRAKGHFTHNIERPQPLQSKSPHWSKGRRVGDGPSLLHTRRWRHIKTQRTLHGRKVYIYGVLHGGLWIRLRGLLDFWSCPPPRGATNEISRRSRIIFF